MSRKPDFRLKMLNKVTEEKGEVGAGWFNGADSITVVLNPCVVLRQSKDIVLTLFLTSKGEESKQEVQ